MTTADIISLMTLIITLFTFLPMLFSILKLFLVLSTIKRKNRIFYIYKLLSPDLFENKSRINEIEERIWNRLHESLFNIFLSAFDDFSLDKFKNEKNNKELAEILGTERLISLFILWMNLNKLKKKFKFIAKEISKILTINKNCRYDRIVFNKLLLSDKNPSIKYTKIYPIDYLKTQDFCLSFAECYNQQQNKETKKEENQEVDFDLKTILRNTKKGVRDYVKYIKEKKFSILISFSEQNNFLLSFDNKNRQKWDVKKLDKSQWNSNVKECMKNDEDANKIKKILNWKYEY